MRTMRKFLVVVVVLLATAIGVVYWLLADPNRFKGEITELVARETGLALELRGDLGWRLWPPVRLVAEDIAADWQTPGESPLVHIESLELDADLLPLITGDKRLNVSGVNITGLTATLVERAGKANWSPPGAAKREAPPVPVGAAPADESAAWAVDVVTLRDSRIDYDIDGELTRLDIDEIIVANVAPGATSPTKATLRVTTGERTIDVDARADVTTATSAVRIENGELEATLTPPSIPVSATFSATYDLDRERLAVEFDAGIETFTIPTEGEPVALGAGGFAAVAFAAPAIANDPSLDEPILPLEAIRAVDWNGELRIARLDYGGTIFPNAKITTANTGGRMTGTLELPQFFGGSATSDWSVDARRTPKWHVAPALERIDSKAFLEFLQERHEWAALFLGSSDLSMTGNTQRELITSMKGKTSFDGGQGKLDIKGIRDVALAIAARAGGTERIAAWPEVLDYKRFTGNWDVDGTSHRLNLLLDNLAIDLNGTLDPITEALDMAVGVTVQDIAEYRSFEVDPLLMGLSLPIRCQGTVSEPRCKADEEGTKKLVAQVLSGKNPELKAKVDKAIDEKVPEQYRDAARSLLDMLGKGQQKQSDQ